MIEDAQGSGRMVKVNNFHALIDLNYTQISQEYAESRKSKAVAAARKTRK